MNITLKEKCQQHGIENKTKEKKTASQNKNVQDMNELTAKLDFGTCVK